MVGFIACFVAKIMICLGKILVRNMKKTSVWRV